jgi:hypothetical protein
MTDRVCNYYAAFLRSVAVLSLPVEMQIRWLKSLGLGEPGMCDELALEFADGWLLVE